MKKIILIFMTVLLMASITATAITAIRSRDRPQILLDNNSLTISRERGRIVIYSHTDSKEYNFRITRKHATETPSEGYTAVESDNIKIVVKPKKIILYDKAEKKVYTLRLFFGHLTLKPFSTGISGRKGAIE